MKHQILFSLCSLFLAGTSGYAQQSADRIDGSSSLRVGSEQTYAVTPRTDVVAYQWIPPRGCRLVAGQGTEQVRLNATFLAQSGPLRLVRTLTDERRDTLSLSIEMDRYITQVIDHTINPGDSVLIAGQWRKHEDIYYEPLDAEGLHVAAHRLTVKDNRYVAMTEPYLQTASDTGIWVTWKTDFDNSPEVLVGTDSTRLARTVTGTTEALSDTYYWNSVQITGLQPSTTYYYRTRSGSQMSRIYRFHTLPKPGSRHPLRILLMGDHQINNRSGYQWLMQAAQRKIRQKYGEPEDNIDLIMNVGDQVDNGTLEQYEWVHLFKSRLLSPRLPIMTAVGNHETYSDPGMAHYAAHYHYEDLSYRGIKSGTENYYAYQAGRLLFIVLSTEHTGAEQKAWVRRVVDAAKTDDSVDFIISVNHRPIQAEQYIGDISSWVRNEIIPILSETPKHVFNYGGHHHLYHRGQLTDYPVYHIINGAASWDQLWGMSSEQDMDDVQKTIDYWGYQILSFDFDKRQMQAECYAIGNRDLVVDNILIDSFSRTLGQTAPQAPALDAVADTVSLPMELSGSAYATTTEHPLNTTQFQVSTEESFNTLALNSVRDVEDFYGSTHKPLHIPIDLNEGVDITKFTIEANRLKNGRYYARVRYRDDNLEWSAWSDVRSFVVTGSMNGDPALVLTDSVVAPGQTVSISYQFAPVGNNAWIGIYRHGEKPGTGQGTKPSVKWGYTQGAAGTMNFNLNETGEYFATLFKDGGYTECAPRKVFYVGPVPQLSTNRTIYAVGDTVRVAYSQAPGLKNDWIGIYRMGKVPANIDLSDSWQYTPAGSTEGEMLLSCSGALGQAATRLPKGYYFAAYFTCGEYFEPGERVYFSVGDSISRVAIDTTRFAVGQDVNVHYAAGPGTPKDWVGLFAEGKDPNRDMLDGFYYTYGATDGTVTIPHADLKPGRYFAALFINDSYTEVSNRVHFIVDEAEEPVSINAARNERPVVALRDGELTVQAATDTHLALYSSAGLCLRRLHAKSGNLSLSLAGMPRGIYVVRLSSAAGVTTRKIVIP